MQRLPDIKATYDWFFAYYIAETLALAKKNDIVSIDQMGVKRDILERSIFVLMFAQFEKAVTSAFESALKKRATNTDWKHRRGWDASSLKGKRVPFETKLAMVLDSRSSSFAQIMKMYETRNHCAHGGTTNAVGSIDGIAADLYRWYGELKT